MNISLPETLTAFLEEQVSQRGYATINDYVRELIRKDQERQALRGLLQVSGPVAGTGATYAAVLKARLQRRATALQRAAGTANVPA